MPCATGTPPPSSAFARELASERVGGDIGDRMSGAAPAARSSPTKDILSTLVQAEMVELDVAGCRL